MEFIHVLKEISKVSPPVFSQVPKLPYKIYLESDRQIKLIIGLQMFQQFFLEIKFESMQDNFKLKWKFQEASVNIIEQTLQLSACYGRGRIWGKTFRKIYLRLQFMINYLWSINYGLVVLASFWIIQKFLNRSAGC